MSQQPAHPSDQLLTMQRHRATLEIIDEQRAEDIRDGTLSAEVHFNAATSPHETRIACGAKSNFKPAVGETFRAERSTCHADAVTCAKCKAVMP